MITQSGTEPERMAIDIWDYPRPPRVEPVRRRAVLVVAGIVVADTDDVVRVLETSHPPTYYLPRAAFGTHLRRAAGSSWCEWKGAAAYVDVVVGDVVLERVGWCYPRPSYPELADRVAVYPGPFDSVTLDGVAVVAQPGGFYGGWVTPEIRGPFKGGPGTMGW